MEAETKFTDLSKDFLVKVGVFAELLPALMAARIEATMKTSGEVPLLPKSTKWAQRGALRASIRSTKLSFANYAVTVGMNSPAAAYAAAQEAGITRGHVMRNYSTPGTGPHFFRHAIDAVEADMRVYAIQAAKGAGIAVGDEL